MNAAPPHGRQFSAPYGFVEWFRPGEYERTTETLPHLLKSGASYLRTHLSWAEYLAEGGEAWFDWLIPQLGREVDLLPCIHYTPPSLSRNGRTTGAPRVLKDYADFVDHVLTRYGKYFEYVELWNEPNNLLDWDWREDTDYLLFCEMVGGAAYWVRQRGWKPVLGGPCPFDAHWLDLMGERGVLQQVSAVGLHGFPGTWDSDAAGWSGWDLHVAEARDIVSRYNGKAGVWVTETGYSTWRRDEAVQVRSFLSALNGPADRMYWYSWRDIPSDIAVQEGLWFDPRHYHLGVVDQDNRPKLLARLLMAGDTERLERVAALATPHVARPSAPIVITGGSGFIGSNLADSFLADGEEVVVIDNLSRDGVDENLDWLTHRHGERVHPLIADVRDVTATEGALGDAKAVFHLAAQTAVTTSLTQPVEDFEINARGTLNVLEAVRRGGAHAPVIFASTNKVYGSLGSLEFLDVDARHLPADAALRAHGIAETQPLDFCTPYGCSKGVADQYVLDYAKSYGIPAAVLRMSCIYGQRQFGTEDQGWVAHFVLQALKGEPITLYGDGNQVRDILHVNDAVAAYRAVLRSRGDGGENVFNLGGGIHNAVSLKMVLGEIERLSGRRLKVRQQDWRPGDQLYFTADTRRLRRATGWKSRIGWRQGVGRLYRWLEENRAPAAPVLLNAKRERA